MQQFQQTHYDHAEHASAGVSDGRGDGIHCGDCGQRLDERGGELELRPVWELWLVQLRYFAQWHSRYLHCAFYPAHWRQRHHHRGRGGQAIGNRLSQRDYQRANRGYAEHDSDVHVRQ
jgi:hypothetical protein